MRGGASPNWTSVADTEYPFDEEAQALVNDDELDVDKLLARLLPTMKADT